MTTSTLQLIWPHWEVIALLGEGAFGQVYKIRRIGEPEQFAALKVIRIPQSEGEIRRLRSMNMDEQSVSEHFAALAEGLSREITTLSQFSGHSNIVSYQDHEILANEDGIGRTILIRMELLTPLVRHMTEQPLGQSEVLRLGADICRALELCQRHRIIHRDIKPDNIFLSSHGGYKLGDFGVARELEKTTANLSRKGTFSYMAPEVFHGRPYNQTVDIYSLGIVLYSLLNGNRIPFLPPAPQRFTPNDYEHAQHQLISGEPIPPLPHVPAALNGLVLKMCAYDSKGRYQNADELATALAQAQAVLSMDKTVSLRSWIGDNTPGVAHEAEPPEPEPSHWIDGTPYVPEKEPEPEPAPPVVLTPKKSPGRALVAVLAGVVVLLAGVVAWLAMRGRPEPVVDVDGGTSTSASDVSTDPETTPAIITTQFTTTENTTTSTTTSTTKATTTTSKPVTKKQKPEWAAFYEKVLEEEKKAWGDSTSWDIKFDLVDLDGNGVPELVAYASGRSKTSGGVGFNILANSEYQTRDYIFNFEEVEGKVYFRKEDTRTLFIIHETRNDDRNHCEFYQKWVYEKGKLKNPYDIEYDYRTGQYSQWFDDDYAASEAKKSDYDAIKREVQSYTSIINELTNPRYSYSVGTNLEDYWN